MYMLLASTAAGSSSSIAASSPSGLGVPEAEPEVSTAASWLSVLDEHEGIVVHLFLLLLHLGQTGLHSLQLLLFSSTLAKQRITHLVDVNIVVFRQSR